jgi:hypothetical protein
MVGLGEPASTADNADALVRQRFLAGFTRGFGLQ